MIKRAFTIIELLVVIVIIGILATIITISFSNISQRSISTSIQADLTNASKSIENFKTSSSTDVYPTLLSDAGVKASSNNTQTYNTSPDFKSYCIQNSNSGITYSITNTDRTPKQIACSQNGLVGWWKLNANTNDSSIFGNNGTNVGAVSSAGQNAQSTGYTFSGTNYITVPNSNSLKINSEITLSAWVNFQPGSMGVYQFIISRFPYFELNKGGTNQIRIEVLCSDNTSRRAEGGGTSLNTTGVWYFVAASFNIINGEMNLYVNGVKQTTQYVDPKQSCSSMSNLDLATNLGARNTTGLYAILDDLRVYNRVLSQNEVSQLYTDLAQ